MGIHTIAICGAATGLFCDRLNFVADALSNSEQLSPFEQLTIFILTLYTIISYLKAFQKEFPFNDRDEIRNNTLLEKFASPNLQDDFEEDFEEITWKPPNKEVMTKGKGSLMSIPMGWMTPPPPNNTTATTPSPKYNLLESSRSLSSFVSGFLALDPNECSLKRICQLNSMMSSMSANRTLNIDANEQNLLLYLRGLAKMENSSSGKLTSNLSNLRDIFYGRIQDCNRRFNRCS